MVGWQPNYSNPDFIRMKKGFRRRRKKMKIIQFFILLFLIFTFTTIGYIFISNENFTAAILETATEMCQEFEEPKSNKFNGKIYNEYLITETP